MVCVAEDNLRGDIVAQFMDMDSFDRSECADWHENRRFDFAVVGSDYTSTCVAVRSCCGEFEVHLSYRQDMSQLFLEKFFGICAVSVERCEFFDYHLAVFRISYAEPMSICVKNIY